MIKITYHYFIFQINSNRRISKLIEKVPSVCTHSCHFVYKRAAGRHNLKTQCATGKRAHLPGNVHVAITTRPQAAEKSWQRPEITHTPSPFQKTVTLPCTQCDQRTAAMFLLSARSANAISRRSRTRHSMSYIDLFPTILPVRFRNLSVWGNFLVGFWKWQQ